jgi:hypothetical protein
VEGNSTFIFVGAGIITGSLAGYGNAVFHYWENVSRKRSVVHATFYTLIGVGLILLGLSS